MAEVAASNAELLVGRLMTVSARRTVAAPPAAVWSLVGDQTTWLRWYTPLSRFEPVGMPTSGLGAVFAEQEWVWKTTSEIVEWEPGRCVGLATRSINLAGLLRGYYRRIELEPGEQGDSTVVTIGGGFRFGWLGLSLFPYTYPQMLGSLYFEYRSALSGLDKALAGTT